MSGAPIGRRGVSAAGQCRGRVGSGVWAVAALLLAAQLLVPAASAGAQSAGSDVPPAAENLRCIAEVGRVAFLWDAAEWSGAESVSYDYELRLPDGRTEGGNLRGMTLVYRPGQYRLGGEATLSITVRYEPDSYSDVFSERESLTCYIGGVKLAPASEQPPPEEQESEPEEQESESEQPEPVPVTVPVTVPEQQQVLSSDASLSGLAVYRATSKQPDADDVVPYAGSAYVLRPALTAGVYDYRVRIPDGASVPGPFYVTAVVTAASDAKSVTVTGRRSNEEARTPKSDVGSGEASGPWQTFPGYGLIEIEVTAQDGIAKQTYRVILERGAVDDPRKVAVAAGDESLTLTWEPFTGANAPTSYVARWRKTGTQTWLNSAWFQSFKTGYGDDAPNATAAEGQSVQQPGQSAPKGTYTITGLDNGTAYDVELRGIRGGHTAYGVMNWLESNWTKVSATPAAAPAPVLSSDASLSALAVYRATSKQPDADDVVPYAGSAYVLRPALTAGVYEYRVRIPDGASVPDPFYVTAVMTASDAKSITVTGRRSNEEARTPKSDVGSGEASGPWQTFPGYGLIEIEVTAQDGIAKQTYRVILERGAVDDPRKVALAARDQSLTLSWEPFTGANAPSSYLARWRKTGTQTWLNSAWFQSFKTGYGDDAPNATAAEGQSVQQPGQSAPKGTYTITGLDNGTAYDVELRGIRGGHTAYSVINWLESNWVKVSATPAAPAVADPSGDLMMPPCTPDPDAAPQAIAATIVFVMCDDGLTVEHVVTPDGITLVPEFSPERLNYLAVVDDDIAQLGVTGRFKIQNHADIRFTPGLALAYVAKESGLNARSSSAHSNGDAKFLHYNMRWDSARPPDFTPQTKTYRLSPGVTPISLGSVMWVTNWGCGLLGPAGGRCTYDQWGDKVRVSDYRLQVVWKSPGTATAVPQEPVLAKSVDYDTDDDGLIEISNLAQLNAIRWDADGDGYSDHGGRLWKGFPNALGGMGCPASGCLGYELVADLDFDTNGNGSADAGDDWWNSGHGWLPIGADTADYNAVFEGNRHTISNLHIDSTADTQAQARRFVVSALTPMPVGLFDRLGASGDIRNVGLESADVSRTFACSHGSYYWEEQNVCREGYVGALVGVNHGRISGSYATGSVSNALTGAQFLTEAYERDRVIVGGLVGRNEATGVIAASYSRATVTGRVDPIESKPKAHIVGARVGGLVGDNRGAILASFAVGLTSYNGVIDVAVGGLAGHSHGASASVTASYAVGLAHGATASMHGVVARGNGSVTDSYCDTTTFGRYCRGTNANRGAAKTTAELQTPTAYSGIYADWNLDLDGDGTGDDPWDFGTASQYPVLKHAGLDPATQRTQMAQTAPGTPLALELALSTTLNNGVTATWRLPRTGDLPTGYTVRVATLDDQEVERTQAESGQYTAGFEGLDSGETYRVGVQAVNGAGASDWAAATITLPEATVLAQMTLSTGSIPFSPDKTSYKLSVAYEVSRLTVTPVAYNSQSAITVAGETPATPVPLQVRDNLIEVVVTAPDGIATQTYTIKVTRRALGKPGPVRNLRVLRTQRGEIFAQWDPPTTGGSPERYEYREHRDSLMYANHGTRWSGSVRAVGALRTSGVFSPHPATLDYQYYEAEVRAVNSTGAGPWSKIDIIGWERTALGGLDVAPGRIEFSPSKTSYSMRVGEDVDSVVVTPTPFLYMSAARVVGHEPGAQIPLAKGHNEIQVVVSIYTGNSTTYTVNVARGNDAPTVSSSLSDVAFVNERGTQEVSLAGLFDDAENDPLTITAASSDTAVATVSVSSDFSTLTVKAKAAGTATITVSADDGGGPASTVFEVTVKSTPTSSAPVGDITDLEVGETREISLSDRFSDVDGDTLTIRAEYRTSHDPVATVSLASDGSKLTFAGRSVGTMRITLTVADPDGNQITEVFDVTVVVQRPQQQQTATSPFSPLVAGYDANSDGILDKYEYRVALRDFSARRITMAQIREVRAAYYASRR